MKSFNSFLTEVAVLQKDKDLLRQKKEEQHQKIRQKRAKEFLVQNKDDKRIEIILKSLSGNEDLPPRVLQAVEDMMKNKSNFEREKIEKKEREEREHRLKQKARREKRRKFKAETEEEQIEHDREEAREEARRKKSELIKQKIQ